MNQEQPGRYTRRSRHTMDQRHWDDEPSAEGGDKESLLDLLHLQRGDAFTVEVKTHPDRPPQERLFVKHTENEGCLKGWYEVRLESDEPTIVPVELMVFEPSPYGSSFWVHTVVLQQGLELGVIDIATDPSIVDHVGIMQRFDVGAAVVPDLVLASL